MKNENVVIRPFDAVSDLKRLSTIWFEASLTPIRADSVAPSVETPEHDAPIKYILGTSVPPLAVKTMRAIAARVTFYRAPRFLTFSGRGSRARRLEMGVMPPVSALVRYGVFDALPVARGVSCRTT